MPRKKGSKNKKSVVTNPIVNESWNEPAPETNAGSETPLESTDSGMDENAQRLEQGSEESQPVDYKKTLAEFDQVLENAKNVATENTPQERKRRTKVELAQEKVKVPGRLFALMVDRLFANGLSIIDSATNKQPETIIPAQWLMADDKTLEELAPVASMAAAELGIEEHPTVTLFGLLLSNQLSQFMALKAMIRQEKKRNPDFDVMDLKPTGK